MRYFILLPFAFLLKRKGSLLTSSMAVAATIYVLVFTNTIIAGSFNGLLGDVTDLRLGHIQIRDMKGSIIDPSANIILETVCMNPYVLAAAPRITTISGINHTTWNGGLKSKYGVETIGVDPILEKDVSTLARAVVEGSFQLTQYSIVLGSNLARDLDAKVGDGVTLRLSSAKGIPVKKELRVDGILTSVNVVRFSDAAFVHIDTLRKLIGLKHSDASAIIIRLVDPTYAEGVKQWIQLEFPLSNLEVQTLAESTRTYLAGISAVIGFINIVGYVGLIAAALGVITILSMMVTSKTRDIGVLRAIGLQKTGVLLTFVVAGAMIGIFGAIAGGLLGAATTLYLQERPTAFAMGITMRVTFSIDRIAYPMVIGFLMSFLSSIYPAWRASGLEPAEAMRYF